MGPGYATAFSHRAFRIPEGAHEESHKGLIESAHPPGERKAGRVRAMAQNLRTH